MAFLVVAPWPMVRSSPIRRSRALFDEPKAWGAVGAHRESRRRGLRRLEGLQMAGRRRWQRLEREGGAGEVESEENKTKTRIR